MRSFATPSGRLAAHILELLDVLATEPAFEALAGSKVEADWQPGEGKYDNGQTKIAGERFAIKLTTVDGMIFSSTWDTFFPGAITATYGGLNPSTRGLFPSSSNPSSNDMRVAPILPGTECSMPSAESVLL